MEREVTQLYGEAGHGKVFHESNGLPGSPFEYPDENRFTMSRTSEIA